MKRLHLKATSEGKQAVISTDGSALYIDGNLVFSLHEGFVHNVANATVFNNTTNV